MSEQLDYQALAKEFFEAANYFFYSFMNSELRNDEELEKKYCAVLQKGDEIFKID